MDLSQVFSAVGVAALGYAVKSLQDWFGWRRRRLEEIRNRWKFPRQELIVHLMDESLRLMALAPLSSGMNVAVELKEFDRLQLQGTLLMAHRETTNNLMVLRGGLEGLLLAPAGELQARFDATQLWLWRFVNEARVTELGLSSNNIVTNEHPERLRSRISFWWHTRQMEKRRG